MSEILENINIVLTRAKNQSVETIKQLEDLGAKVLSFPTIQISTITDSSELNETIKNIGYYNSLIFTSENAVKSFIEKIEELGIHFDPKAFFVISIGDRTTHVCKEFGFRIDFQSKLSTSDSLLKELGYIDLIGRKILVPCSKLSNPNQFESLCDHGAIVHSVPVYNNCVNNKEHLLNELKILKITDFDLFIFTSPSTFKGFLEILSIDNPTDYFREKNIAVIGPVTKEALVKAGIEPNIIPQNFTMNYLIEEIKKFYNNEKVIN